jgi:hypothetical protein
MTEPELRALVRDVIARRASDVIARHTRQEGSALDPRAVEASPLMRQHSSHAMFMLPAGSDSDGPCLIEPAVMCTHCGYCKSYGH